MFSDREYVQAYNDGTTILFVPTTQRGESGYKLMPKIEGEPVYESILWVDIRDCFRKSTVIRKRKLRFAPEVEEQVYKELKFIPEKERDSFTMDEIEQMILNPTQEVYETILNSKDFIFVNTVFSTLIGMKNSNAYEISSRFEDYVRAKQEELKQGKKVTDLEYEPSENSFANNEEEEEEVVNKEEESKAPVKPKAPAKTSTAKAKTSTGRARTSAKTKKSSTSK